MIEKIYLDYLNSVQEIPVYTEEPSNKPEEYYLLEKTGSGFENHIFTATLVIQSYGGSLFRAAEMNEQIIQVMHNSVVLDEVGSCRLNSDYNYTDINTKRYRYQAVFDIVHY